MIAPLRIEARDHDGRELQAEMLTGEDIARLEGIHVRDQGAREKQKAAWEDLRARLQDGLVIFPAHRGRPWR